MRTLRPLMFGLCLAAAGAAVAAPNRPTAERVVDAWPAVPDSILSHLHGRFDLGTLVVYFAIERVVEVNGEVIARAQIVISNLDRLASGGLPTVTVTGPLAQVIQIMNGRMGASAVLASSGAPATAATPSATGASPAAPSVGSARTPLATAASAVTPINASPQASGTISSGGTQSGSTAQFGSALASAVAAAAGATSATGAGHAPAEAPSVSAASLASAQPAASTVPAAASAAASPASAAAQTAIAAPIIPTPVIVVSNLPNATAITTAVQNEVRATTIQTQTTISATLNSIPAFNALALSNAIQAQVASALGH